jgi:hypothetical protein
MRVSVVDKWTQSLHEEFDMRVQVTWISIQAAKMLVEATWCKFNMQVAEVET